MNINEVFQYYVVGLFSGGLFTVAPTFIGSMFNYFKRLMTKVS